MIRYSWVTPFMLLAAVIGVIVGMGIMGKRIEAIDQTISRMCVDFPANFKHGGQSVR